jgi:hypothetical protein
VLVRALSCSLALLLLAASSALAEDAREDTPEAAPVPRAAPERLLVLELIDKGAGPGAVGALSQAIAGQALASFQGAVVTPQQIRSTLEAGALQALAGCDTDKCMVDLGETVEADRVLGGNVARVADDLIVTLVLVEPRSGARLGELQRKVPDYQDLSFYAARNMAGELLTGSKLDDKVPVRLSSEPPGAVVFLDGEKVGLTPVIVSVLPGQHDVLIRADGYTDWRLSLVVEGGTPAAVDARLSSPPLRLWPAAAAMGGVAVLGAGGALTAGLVAINRYDGSYALLTPDEDKAASYYFVSPVDSPALKQKEQTVTQLATAANILWAVGASAGIVAAGLLAADIALWATHEE